MALYKESLINKIEDDLTGRNQNWDAIETHMAEDSQKHITESGENENGRYVRFDDGTMICFTSKSRTPVASIIDFGYILYGSTFLGTPIVNVSKSEADSQSWTGQVHIGAISNTGARVVFTNLGTGNPYRANLIAIGRWK